MTRYLSSIVLKQSVELKLKNNKTIIKRVVSKLIPLFLFIILIIT